jgi:hypothetical protein
MRPAFSGQFVQLGFTACLGRLPGGGRQLFVFEAADSGLKGPLLDLQGLARHLLSPLRDGVTVNGAKRNHPHDEEIECALREIEFSSVFFMPNSSTYTLRYVEGQGVCFGVYGVRPQSRVDPQTETASSGCCVLRLQNAILERKYAEFSTTVVNRPRH